MSKRNLSKQFTRILRDHQIDHRVLAVDDTSSTVAFGLENGIAEPIGVTTILDGEVAIFIIPTGIEIPEARMDDAVGWVLDINGTHAPATFLLDLEERSLAIRHAVDCGGIPTDVLDTILPRAWVLLAETWRDFAPEILRLIAGQVSEFDQATAGVTRQLKSAVADRFDRDVADALDTPLETLAIEYLRRIHVFEIDSIEDVDIRIKGTDDEAVVTISVDGLSPLRFRFSPRKARERFLADNQGLTLYLNVLPDQAERVLASGFVDERIAIRDYQADHDGVPMLDGDAQVTTAVPLTSAPLGPDDRAARTAVIRIEWDGDAPSLRDFEQHHIVHDDAEMSVVDDEVRRWNVPADTLNEAVRTHLASLNYLA